MNHYNLLGLPLDATSEEIRKAYFDSAKKYHPDVNASDELKERFIQNQEAYETLIDPDKRKDYNSRFNLKDSKESQILINAYYSRSVIPLISEKQAFYLLLDIFSPENLAIEDLPIVNLCLVVDKSTSMQGLILNKIKYEIANLIGLLKAEDKVSIVTFSDRAEVVLPACKVKEIGNNISKIQSISASGGTEILQGLKEGIKILNKLDPTQPKVLYLITDGHTYGDEEECIKTVRMASEDGIIVQAIGVGEDWNDDFLDNLSEISGGETQFVTSSQELYNLLKEKILSFGILYSKAIKIFFNFHENVKLNYAFRLSPDLSKLEVSEEINLGSLYSGKHLRVIFEFIIEELPASINEIRISRGSIKVEIPANMINMQRYFYDFKRPVKPKIEVEKVPPILVNALSTLSLYRLQEKAKEDVNNGKISDATRKLHHLASHLVSKGDRELAKTILNEVESIQKTNHFTELGKKKIKYGTRSLLLPKPQGEDS